MGVLAAICLSSGCSERVYRVANLPPEFYAPAPLDLEALNLSGLTDQSVSAEVIQPGDLLEISMVTDYTKLTTTSSPVRVADDGSIVVPLVGRISVGGLEVEKAEQFINSQSIVRGVFRTPCITVTMKQCHTSKVTVVGAVNKPGTVSLPRGSTSLMAALLAAGGLSKDAGTDVEIRHTDTRNLTRAMPPPNLPVGADGSAAQAAYAQAVSQVTRVDLAGATAGAVKVPDLADGDVVHVSKRTLQPVQVIGLVQKPGQFPYPPDKELRVLDALALAGGCNNPVAEDILVIRHVATAAEPVRIKVSLQAAKNGRDNLLLAPGDTVSVEQTALTAVADTIRTFIRFSVGGTLSWF